MAEEGPAPNDAGVTVRGARADDADDVAELAADTWRERGVDDYVPEVFPEWVAEDDDDRRTVAAVDDASGTVVGVVQVVRLSPWEAWCQGMRVHPEHRGRGVGAALDDACTDWARERGAAVARLMVFSWNRAGLAAARANGYEPVTEFRWAHPEPHADDGPDGDRPTTDGTTVAEAPDDAYAFWRDSAARDHLRGLGLDLEESWACSALTRADLRAAERTVCVRREAGVVAATYRTRTYDREADGATETWAEYGAAAWRDLGACRALFGAIADDAGSVGADRTRVLVPETARHVTDAARAGAALSDDPDFVLAADLTGR